MRFFAILLLELTTSAVTDACGPCASYGGGSSGGVDPKKVAVGIGLGAAALATAATVVTGATVAAVGAGAGLVVHQKHKHKKQKLASLNHGEGTSYSTLNSKSNSQSKSGFNTGININKKVTVHKESSNSMQSLSARKSRNSLNQVSRNSIAPPGYNLKAAHTAAYSQSGYSGKLFDQSRSKSLSSLSNRSQGSSQSIRLKETIQGEQAMSSKSGDSANGSLSTLKQGSDFSSNSARSTARMIEIKENLRREQDMSNMSKRSANSGLRSKSSMSNASGGSNNIRIKILEEQHLSSG